jgi:hypothetical protein
VVKGRRKGENKVKEHIIVMRFHNKYHHGT